MVISEVVLAVAVELFMRRAGLSLASVLWYRSSTAVVWLALFLRPRREEWTPRARGLALLRLLAGGLTYVGWFGAIGTLSARVTAAVLLLDSLVLAYVRGKRRPYEKWTISILAAALVVFALQGIREPGTVTNLHLGIFYLVLAIGARAASYKIWEASQNKQEHLFWLIAPSLIGGALGGLFLGRMRIEPISPGIGAMILLVSAIGLVGYFYMNEVIAMLGAFYTRVVELWQVPLLWGIHLFTDKARPDWIEGGASLLVCVAAALTYAAHRRNLPREETAS